MRLGLFGLCRRLPRHRTPHERIARKVCGVATRIHYDGFGRHWSGSRVFVQAATPGIGGIRPTQSPLYFTLANEPFCGVKETRVCHRYFAICIGPSNPANTSPSSVLVLDEATSHLDVEKERKVNLAINSLNITRLTIAHRAETIGMADRAVSLDASIYSESRIGSF